MVYDTATMVLDITPHNSEITNSVTPGATVVSTTGTIPNGATITSGTIYFPNIGILTSKGMYFYVTDLGNTTRYAVSDTTYTYQLTGSLTLQWAAVATGLFSFSAGSAIGFHFNGAKINFRGGSCTITVNYQYDDASQYSKSTGTLSSQSVTADGEDTIDLAINASSNILTHRVTWSLGNYVVTQNIPAGIVATTLLCPLQWNNAITSATSGTGTVVLETFYSGSSIGQNQYTFTVNVPSSIVPTISTITATQSSDIPAIETLGIYVQDNSYVTIAVSGVSGAYGSTIRSYTFSGSSLGSTISSSESSASATSGLIASSGNVKYSVVATDSRGRKSATKEITISVQQYSTPTFQRTTAMRTNSSGTASDTGTYITTMANIVYSSVSGNNSCTWKWEYQQSNGSFILGGSGLSSGATSTGGNGTISTAYTYNVKFTATDTFGNSATKIVQVSVTDCTMFFKSGGLGVGIGMQTAKPQSTPALEISEDWGIYYGDRDLAWNVFDRIVYSATEPSNPVEGMIWLKPTEGGGGGGGGGGGSSNIIVVSDTNISSLPHPISNSAITSDYVLLESEISDESVMVGDWTVSTSTGVVTIDGDIDGETNIKLVLGLPAN